MNSTVWKKLQSIDPRVLYTLLIIMIALPMVFPQIALPIVPGQQTKDAYNKIEEIAAQRPIKPVIVDGMWSASTRGESQWQSQAVIEHLMRRHIPFIIISGDPQNPELMSEITNSLAKKYGCVYGRDYVSLGFIVAYTQVLKSACTDFDGTLKTDINHTKLTQLPVTANIKTIKDIGGVIEITPTSSVDMWLGLVVQKYHTPLIYVPTAVMAPEGYPYRDSGQIAGIVTGVKGAGDYEALLGTKREGTQISTSLSMIYGFIILLIVLGNIGYHVNRIAEQKELAEGKSNR